MKNKKTEQTAVTLLLASIFLLAGALYTFVTGKWFPGFPPQFDALLLVGGPYVQAAIVLMLAPILAVAAFKLTRLSK